MENKWKFFYNGDGWWLKITSFDQLLRYVEETSGRFGTAMMDVVDHRVKNIDGHYTNDLSSVIDSMQRFSNTSLLETSMKLSMMAGETYINILHKDGFVNINKCGGCNSINWPEKLIEFRDKLVFPNAKKSNVEIKTFENAESKYGEHRENYQYHWYVYVDGVQMKYGDKTKFDTKEEAELFAQKCLIKE